MRNMLRFFGLLDVLSILLLAPQMWLLINNFNYISGTPLLLISTLRILLFLSLFLSATGSLTLKQYGRITYYVQFIFRFITLVFSFGFITYLNDLFKNTEAVIKATLTLAIFGEFLRLYITVRNHPDNKILSLFRS